MITIKHEVNSGKSLIVLIHGFMGSEKTWVKADGTMPFISQLLEDKEVRDNFTIATFDYHSNLMTFFPKVNAMWNYIAGKKNPFNLPTESIAQLLQSQLTYRYDSYENIVLIGHSMGGLVAKRYVLDDILKHSTSRVKLYVSLATPHNGSDLATIGNALIENIQIKALKPLAEGVIKMGNEWVQCKALPRRLYAQGKYDKIVPEQSSVPFDKEIQEVIFCDDDHSSIIVPTNRSIVVDAITQELKEIIKSQKIQEIENREAFVDDGRYDEETFVLKLLMADIHQTLVSGTKEAFFQAEFAVRKLDALGVNFDKLIPLYTKLKQIYVIEFGKFVSGQHASPDALLTAVHAQIKAEDKTELQTLYTPLQSLQKFGLLHQLANRDTNIWWDKDHDLSKYQVFATQPKQGKHD